jgi:rhodanese-related sulfurtransferase
MCESEVVPMGFLAKLFGKKEAAAPPPAQAPAPAAAKAATPSDEWDSGAGVPQELAAGEALALYESTERPVFLDVREEQELINFGFIPGSVHIPMSEIQGRADELQASKAVVVYCASGMRSMDVGFFLIQQGFKNVSNLNGGINSWSGPIEQKKP